MSTSQLQQGQLFRQFSEISHYLSFFFQNVSDSKEEEERGSQEEEKPEEDSSQRSHLLPTPY